METIDVDEYVARRVIKLVREAVEDERFTETAGEDEVKRESILKAVGSFVRKIAPQHPNTYKWTTGDELRFLELLGSYSARGRVGRYTLLRRYRDSMARRSNWADIDKATVALYVESELLRYRRVA